MNQIIINTESNDLVAVVTNRELKKIDGIIYAGGFKRFSLSIYDDTIRSRKSDFNKVLAFLSSEVFLISLNDLKQAIS